MKVGQITIDKSGRIVLPKKARELYRVIGGEQFELFIEGTYLVLKPAHEKGGLQFEDGILVFSGGESLPNESYVDADREARIESLIPSQLKIKK